MYWPVQFFLSTKKTQLVKQNTKTSTTYKSGNKFEKKQELANII
jgi:hypothetical protein